MIFHTFKIAGQEYIAIPKGNGSEHILGQDGANYGSWMTVENFIKARKAELSGKSSKGYGYMAESLGVAELSIRVLS